MLWFAWFAVVIVILVFFCCGKSTSEESSSQNQKPVVLPPSSSSSQVAQTRTVRANQTTGQNFSHTASSPSPVFPPCPSPTNAYREKIIPYHKIDIDAYLNSAVTHSSYTPQSAKPSTSHTTRSSSRTKPPTSSPKPSSSEERPATQRAPSFSTKGKLAVAQSDSEKDQSKKSYVRIETSLTYAIPEDIRDLFKKNQVPGVLKKPLSPSTYKDYFASLLYAEDFYNEQWDGFEIENVTLGLQQASIYERSEKNRNLNEHDEDDGKLFVAFEIDSVPERRPYLLSKDFVFVWPSRTKRTTDPFRVCLLKTSFEIFTEKLKYFEQGVLYRVVKSNIVLADFDKDFHHQHDPTSKYTVKFSFNRVCLKRAHQSIVDVSNTLLKNFLFPNAHIPTSYANLPEPRISNKLDKNEASAVKHILSLRGPPPYIVEGPLSLEHRGMVLTGTGVAVQMAVLQIYRTVPSCKILICAPSNKACDALTRGVFHMSSASGP